MKSYGEKLLGELLKLVFANRFRIIVNSRPQFLYGLELDFYIPELKIAFELQGEQHYDLVDDFYSTNEKFVKQVLNDIQKDLLCIKNGVLLVKLTPLETTPKLFKRRIRDSLFSFYNGHSYSREHKKVVEMMTYRRGKLKDGKYKERKRAINDYFNKRNEYLSSLREMGCKWSLMQNWVLSKKFQNIFSKIREDIYNNRQFRVPTTLKKGITFKSLVNHGLKTAY